LATIPVVIEIHAVTVWIIGDCVCGAKRLTVGTFTLGQAQEYAS
jgi:hypothetical protein